MQVERRIAASPETVFSYLIDPAKFVTWMGRGAELDPRPGGAFRLDVDSGSVASGRYLEVDPPRRLRFSWGWENHPTVPPGATTVEITLRADGSDTVLTLRHLGLPDAESRQQHTDGWGLYTAQLAARFS